MFKLESDKSICCVKGKSAIDHSAVTRWFKKFGPDFKNHEDQGRSDMPKAVDFEVMFQAIEANPASST